MGEIPQEAALAADPVEARSAEPHEGPKGRVLRRPLARALVDPERSQRIGPHGAAVAVGAGNKLTARLQSGYVTSYALVMLLGLIGATSWVLWWAS